MSRQKKYEYVTVTLRRMISKEEKDLQMWKDIISNPNSDFLMVRMANGNIGSTEKRIEEMYEVLSIIDPPKETV